MDKEVFTTLKKAVTALKEDLHEAIQKESVVETKKYLEKIAGHIKALDTAALSAEKEEALKESAKLIDFVLTTPWGAPFIGHSTLLDAAKGFQKIGNVECELTELVIAFRNYEKHYHTQVYNVLETIEEELANEKI